ncbi:MAG: alpha/beta hydrolase family esterase [Planctomycetota bacterium]
MKFRTMLLVLLPAVAGMAALWSRAGADEWPPLHTRLAISTPQGNRECVIHVPVSCDRSRPNPLVIMLHGFGGTALNAAKETGWSAQADQQNFMIVYPEATRPDRTRPANFRSNPQAWNDGSGRFHAAAERIDDVAFIETMIDRINNTWKVDADRIFVTGFSNGASMTFRLGAELPQRFAAIAPVAGTCWTEHVGPSPAVSLCYITGTADSLNPLDGGYPKLAFGGKEQGGQPKPPVQTFIDRWSSELNCPEQPRTDVMSGGVRRRTYGPGRQRSEILWITVEELGHHWPGGQSQAPEFLVGKSSRKLRATETVWDFFKTHPKP